MRTCKNCKKKFEPTYSSVQSVCGYTCTYVYSKMQDQKKAKKKRKSDKKNKKTIHSDVYIPENKETLQKEINHIARLIDKGCRCIDCDRMQAKP